MLKKLLALLAACALLNLFMTANAFASNVRKHQQLTSDPPPETDINSASPNIVSPAELESEDKKYPWLEDMTVELALASNYIFRGISQTENLPAMQGGFTYTFPVGLYASIWGSNVRFVGSNASIELDTVAGWRRDFWKDYELDVHVDRYNYPGAQDLSYNELAASFNYKIFMLGMTYSGNAYGKHKTGTYYIGGLNYDIPSKYALNINDLSVRATFGHSSLSRSAGNSYNDYSAEITKKFGYYALTAQWTSTNGRQHVSPYDGSMITGILSAEI
jgi:uncharacterized protein (TIGR02001 family)